MSRDLDMMTSSSLISSSKLVLDESVSRQVERTVMEYLEAPINPPVDRAGLAQMMKGEMFMHGAVDTPRHKQCTSVIGKFLLVEEKALENVIDSLVRSKRIGITQSGKLKRMDLSKKVSILGGAGGGMVQPTMFTVIQQQRQNQSTVSHLLPLQPPQSTKAPFTPTAAGAANRVGAEEGRPAIEVHRNEVESGARPSNAAPQSSRSHSVRAARAS